MSRVDVERLREIAEVEFVDIVVEAIIPDINELRVILTEWQPSPSIFTTGAK